jgi:spore coat polysaccharide biosynthesis protein SpsF
MSADKIPQAIAMVQVRMDSTRLPGKAMLPVLGKPLIAYLTERLARCRRLDDIVLATSNESSDHPLADFAQTQGITLYRGSKDDVLGRFYNASLQFNATAIVRITGDCPLIDPALVDEVIEFGDKTGADLARNVIDQPDGFPRGMDVEYFRFSTLRYLHENFHQPEYREHVTLAAYRERTSLNIQYYAAPGNASWDPHWRLCVDEPVDLELVRVIIEQLYPQNPEFTLADISRLLKENPQLARINASVRQKNA